MPCFGERRTVYAEEVVDEVLGKIWRRCPKYKGDVSVPISVWAGVEYCEDAESCDYDACQYKKAVSA